MQKLEQKILKKVYEMEAKQTGIEVFFRLVSIIIISTTLSVFILTVIQTLSEQQTFDLLQIFQEDSLVIRTYLSEVMSTIFEELPKNEILAISVLLLILTILLLLLGKNFARMKNKLNAIKRYWLQH